MSASSSHLVKPSTERAESARFCPREVLGLIAAHAGVEAAGRLRRVCRHWSGLEFYALARARPAALLKALAQSSAAFCETAAARQLIDWSFTGTAAETHDDPVKGARDAVTLAICANNSTFVARVLIREDFAASIREDFDDRGMVRALDLAVACGSIDVLEALSAANFSPKAVRAADCGILYNAACHEGNAEVCQALARIYGLTGDDVRACGNAIIRMAAIRAHAEVLCVLARVYGLSATNPADTARVCDGFSYACDCNAAEVLRVFAHDYGLTRKHVLASGTAFYKGAVFNGSDEVLRVLATEYGFGGADIRADNYTEVVNAASEGHTKTLLVLAVDYGLADDHSEELLAAANKAFLLAAAHGYLDAVHVLVDHYAMASARVSRARQTGALFSAACKGHANIVRALATACALTGDNAREHNNRLLRLTARRGHGEVLLVLHDVYGLTGDDARACGNEALRMAAQCGRGNVLQILHDVYGLTGDDARASENEALRMAAQCGHGDVVQILHDVYGLTGDDARACGCEAVLCAISGEHRDVLQILNTDYGVTNISVVRHPRYGDAYGI